MSEKTEKKKKKQNQPKPKQRCEHCGRPLKQQFIGLKHCKCGMSWQKGVGYFQRTSDMIFALERKVIKKDKNSVRTKQVPVIRYKNNSESNTVVICEICNENILKSDGCKPSVLICNGKQYERFKVGDDGDFFEDCGTDITCGNCGAKFGYYHHEGCDCEHCPICGDYTQLLTCGCDVYVGIKN